MRKAYSRCIVAEIGQPAPHTYAMESLLLRYCSDERHVLPITRFVVPVIPRHDCFAFLKPSSFRSAHQTAKYRRLPTYHSNHLVANVYIHNLKLCTHRVLRISTSLVRRSAFLEAFMSFGRAASVQAQETREGWGREGWKRV